MRFRIRPESLSSSRSRSRGFYVACLLFGYASLVPGTLHAGIQLEAGLLPPPKRLVVLSVGINHYPQAGEIPSIAFGEADATAMADAFSAKRTGVAFPEIITNQLLGSQATLAGISGAMQKIARSVEPSDIFLFYFGGMGLCAVDDGHYTFAASDTVWREGGKPQQALRDTDLAALLLQIPAKRQIIILDTCDSRRAVDAIRKALEPANSFNLDTLQRQVAIFATRGMSVESPSIGHGLLTYCLLEGMRGAADVDHTGLITEARLEGYLTWKVPEEYKTISHSSGNVNDEYFYSYSTMNDLALATSAKPPTRGPIPEADAAPVAVNLGNDYALIVASDHYSDGWHTLSNPINDATALRAELVRDYGYDPHRIIELYDRRKSDVIHTVEGLIRQKFGANDRLLVYFAGHGVRDPFDGYIAFADSRSVDKDESHDTLLPFSSLRNALDVIPVPHILLVMDVCYGGIFDAKTSFHSLLGGTAEHPAERDQLILRALKAKSRIYLTSGDENHQVSDGEPGAHSPFSKALLTELQLRGGKEQFLDIATLYSSLRSLPMEPRAGYFDIGEPGQNADFILIPSDVNAADSSGPVR
jgi:uncharacterized caspase-like protein